MIFKEPVMVHPFRFSVLAASFAAAFALCGTNALAQYKYVGPDGRVTYSDQPPPPTAKSVQKTTAAGNTVQGSQGLPFALQQAVKTAPVTLYTTEKCEACDQGRAFLNKRGVPFTEKTVRNQDDFKVFKEATGAGQVPVMMVGTGKQVGFEEGAWNGALNAMGYPPNNVLPAGYRNPPPAPAAPFAPETKTADAPPKGGDAAPSANTPPAPSTPSTGSQPQDSGNRPPSWFKGF
jgi:glutaredoxin